MTSSPTPLAPRTRSTAGHARHEHSWITMSEHPVSTGTALYVRCSQCECWRVDTKGQEDVAPHADSRTVVRAIRTA
ncbi:hypothetical protein FJV46_06185 [Arthrobacter agilis]|uniref:hypothetical protein n=1 Tax=Arthrobacter agilis TaxID=37921 RepID=UPI000B35C0B6|nr:hypothetical protein [Arthrobacter agilis]PPB45557.1 hypothetical protein CI784_10880 [Arthrobacter agilis]TPV26463.1 hypothetical protein FJV46_06185 [Arthrobacter agilis]